MDAAHYAAQGAAAQGIKCVDVSDNLATVADNDAAFARIYLKEKLVLLPTLTSAPIASMQMAQAAVLRCQQTLRGLDAIERASSSDWL